jgi:hypothetical protein
MAGQERHSGAAAPWSLVQSVTLTDGNHVRFVLDAMRVESSSSTGLVLRGFAMTLNGDVMTGEELERDVAARLDRLPDGLPFGCVASLRTRALTRGIPVGARCAHRK